MDLSARTSLRDGIEDNDIVIIQHDTAGKQPAFLFQDEAYRMSFILKKTAKIENSDIQGVWFPDNGKLTLLSLEDFKKKYNNIKSLS